MDAITPVEDRVPVSDSQPDGWTPERRRMALELWAGHELSSPQIAEAIGGGLSHNAVVGYANRMVNKGLAKPRGKLSGQHYTRKPIAEFDASLGISRRTYWRRIAQYGRPDVAPVISRRYKQKPSILFSSPVSTHAFEPDMPRLEFAELTDGVCKFPEGDDLPFVFCGKPSVGGHSWCRCHFPIVYTPRVTA